MIRQQLAIAITLFSSSILAHEFKFDFGLVEAPACYTTVWERSNSISAPVPQNKYGVRVTRLIATVIALPEGQRDIKLLQFCGEAARRELSVARSVANIRSFSELFEEYMRSCTQSSMRTLQIYRAFVDYDERCTPSQ